MKKTRKHNQGFSLIELLIAMTILSIVMVMIVQFMSTTSGAYQKNKKNLTLQTDSMQIMEQMADEIMQARYIRVKTKDKGMYEITRDDASTKNKREVKETSSYPFSDVTAVTFDFVPDNYGNYSKSQNYEASDRKVVLDMDKYTILDEAAGVQYPLSGDSEVGAGPSRSFRAMKKDGIYRYVKPEMIYLEYPVDVKAPTTGVVTRKKTHVLYYFTNIVDKRDSTCGIYMVRYTTDYTSTNGYVYAMTVLLKSYLTADYNHTKASVDADSFTTETDSDALISALKVDKTNGGLITNKVQDFYLSADSEGNAILLDATFADGSYSYHTSNTVICRNSNVLTVRPQKLFKKK